MCVRRRSFTVKNNKPPPAGGGRAGVALHEQGWPSVYEGAFVHGRLVGRGTVTYRNRYDGLLDGFARHGEGTCAYTVGHAIYVGGSVKE